MCFKKRKIHIKTPVRVITPRPPPSISPSKHKKKISEDLQNALDAYRISHPHTVIIDSPKYGLDKRVVLPDVKNEMRFHF